MYMCSLCMLVYKCLIVIMNVHVLMHILYNVIAKNHGTLYSKSVWSEGCG
jgi:hypothetical protein